MNLSIRNRRAGLLFVGAVVAGCASASTPATTGPTIPLDSLNLERGACYGTCEIYQFVVRRNGDITVRKQAGESNSAISRGEAQHLLDLAADAGAMTLPPRIRADSTLCPLEASDHSTIILTAYAPSGAHRVEHYTGCYIDHELRVAPALERLVVFERRIEQLAALNRTR